MNPATTTLPTSMPTIRKSATTASSPAAPPTSRWRGRHELKGGYEWFRSQNTGGNSQSPTGYVFDADYADRRDGDAVLDAIRDV